MVARDDEAGPGSGSANNQGSNKRLIGYVVPQAGATMDVAQLRAALQAALPDHMVPSALMVLERLPLTPERLMALMETPVA